ncbi:transposable element Tcb1 transposase [Trichonephila clavipes]|nr:transposable element Tcb1 transposase [Trichonephila clavipes]
MAVMDRSVTSRTVAQHIESVTHHSVSARTIRRNLQQSGLSARRPLLGLPLTQSLRRLRRQCCDYEAFGHKASECPDNNATKLDVAHLIVIKEKALSKKVLIVDLVLDALIDSGSQVTLIRKSVFDKLNHIQLFPLNSTLRGFGKERCLDPLLELQHPSDLPKLEDGLKRLEKPDPMIQCITEEPVSSGGPADSRIAVWCRPLFPSHITLMRMPTNVLSFGSLHVVRRHIGMTRSKTITPRVLLGTI